jgi:hypothetical protein
MVSGSKGLHDDPRRLVGLLFGLTTELGQEPPCALGQSVNLAALTPLAFMSSTNWSSMPSKPMGPCSSTEATASPARKMSG